MCTGHNVVGSGYPNSDGKSSYSLSSYGNNELDYKQQVVAVGTPLPSASLPQGWYLRLIVFVNRILSVFYRHLIHISSFTL